MNWKPLVLLFSCSVAWSQGSTEKKAAYIIRPQTEHYFWVICKDREQPTVVGYGGRALVVRCGND